MNVLYMGIKYHSTISRFAVFHVIMFADRITFNPIYHNNNITRVPIFIQETGQNIKRQSQSCYYAHLCVFLALIHKIQLILKKLDPYFFILIFSTSGILKIQNYISISKLKGFRNVFFLCQLHVISLILLLLNTE